MTAVSLAPPASPSGRGLIRALWERLFGRRVQAVRVADHTRFLAWWGRILSPLLLVAFSLASLIVLAGQPLAATLAAVAGQGTLDYATVVSLATTAVLIVAMDVVMLLAAVRIRDATEAGRGGWWAYGVVVGLIGVVEALTFSDMLVGQEHPATALAWVLIIARALIAPGCAVFLTVLPNRELTRQDVDRHLLAKTAALLLDQLERMALAGDAAFSEVLHLFLHLSLPDNPQAAASQAARDAELAALLERLSPQAVAREAERLIAGERADLARRLADADRAIQAANADLRQRLSDALLALATRGSWPDWLADLAPDVAAIDPASLVGRAGKPARSAAHPLSKKDELTAILAELGVEPAAKPTPNAKGIYVRSSDIPALSDGTLDRDAATELARRLGDGAMDRRAYTAPLARLLPELARRRQLHPTLIDWQSRQGSGDNGADIAAPSPADRSRDAVGIGGA